MTTLSEDSQRGTSRPAKDGFGLSQFAVCYAIAAFVGMTSIMFCANRWFGFLTLVGVVGYLILLLPCMIVLHFFARLAARRMVPTSRWFQVMRFAPAALVSIAMVSIMTYEALPGTLFRRLVASPMPASATILEQGGDEALLFDRYTVYFAISAQDFPQILAAHAYKEMSMAGERGDVGKLPDSIGSWILDDLGFSQEKLAPYDVFEADLLSDDEKRGGSALKNYLFVTKDRTRVIFVQLNSN